MNIIDENIGKLFQQKLKDAEVQPDAAVWSAIKQQSGISSGLSVLAKAALFLLGTAIVASSYFLWKGSDSDNQISTEMNAVNNQSLVAIESTSNEQEVVEKNQLDSSVEITVYDNQRDIKKINNTSTQNVIIADVDDSDHLNQETNEAPKTISNTNSVIVNTQKPIPTEVVFQPQLVSFDDEDVESIETNREDVESTEVLTVNSDTAKIRFSDNPTICFGEDAILEAIGGEVYEWSNGSNTSKIRVSPVEESTYWVIVYDRYGNEKKHSFNVIVDKECTSIFIPSAFTPNGDGINDNFKAEGLGILSFEMVVFSREGSIMFESNNIEMSWDGTYRGELVKSVAYMYQVVYTDAKGNTHSKKGFVTLIR